MKYKNIFGDRYKVEKNEQRIRPRTNVIVVILFSITIILHSLLSAFVKDKEIVDNSYLFISIIIEVAYLLLFFMKLIKKREIDWLIIFLLAFTALYTFLLIR